MRRFCKRAVFIPKIFIIIMLLSITLSFINSISIAQISETFIIGDKTSLRFSSNIHLLENPTYGPTSYVNPVGYWPMDEGTGAVAHDASGQGLDATLSGCSWVNGSYRKAIKFNGLNDYAIVNNFGAYNDSSGSLNFFITPGSLLSENAIFSYFVDWNNFAYFYINAQGNLVIQFRVDGTDTIRTFPLIMQTKTTYNCAIVSDLNKISVFLNGVLRDSQPLSMWFDDINAGPTTPLQIGTIGTFSRFNGTLDELRYYNRSLDTLEVAALNIMGPFAYPNAKLYSNYMRFVDAETYGSMLIFAQRLNSDDIAYVECEQFLSMKSIVFKSNSSIVLNVWTSLGQPIYTTGTWNAVNFTNTLFLDNHSYATLNWNAYNVSVITDTNSNAFPYNVSLSYGGNQTFLFDTKIGYYMNVLVDGISKGNIDSYHFSNVTSSHEIRVISFPLEFIIKASSDNGTTITPSNNVVVAYNNSQKFVIEVNIGYKIKSVYVDGINQGVLSNYTFEYVKKNHTISVVSELINSSSPLPTLTPKPTSIVLPSVPVVTPDSSSTLTPLITFPQKHFTLELIVGVLTIAVSLLAVIAFAVKQGRITIEIIEM